jgi:hypothetical protein
MSVHFLATVQVTYKTLLSSLGKNIHVFTPIWSWIRPYRRLICISLKHPSPSIPPMKYHPPNTKSECVINFCSSEVTRGHTLFKVFPSTRTAITLTLMPVVSTCDIPLLWVYTSFPFEIPDADVRGGAVASGVKILFLHHNTISQNPAWVDR